MERYRVEPRPQWEDKVVAAGLTPHTPYRGYLWDESACYRLTQKEARSISDLAERVYERCEHAVNRIIEEDRFSELGIDPRTAAAVMRSWQQRVPSLLSRLDFTWDPRQGGVLSGIEALNPAGVHMATELPWNWKQDSFPECSQFNEIYECLRNIFAYSVLSDRRWVFTGASAPERKTARLLYRVARECLPHARYYPLEQLKLDGATHQVLTPEDEAIEVLSCPSAMTDERIHSIADAMSENAHVMFEPAWKELMATPKFLALLRRWNRDEPALRVAPSTLGGTNVQCWMVNNRAAGIAITEAASAADQAIRVFPHVLDA